jgi:hypothetical protein
VIRGSEGAAAVREIRRHRYGREVSGMSDLNWISAANAHHLASTPSKSRADFCVGSEQPIAPILARRKRLSENATQCHCK